MPSKKDRVQERKGVYMLLSMLPPPARFAASGGIGNVLFFFLDNSLFTNFRLPGVISWAVAYLLSIPLQQVLHRHLVYLGDRDGNRSYISELFGLYLSYSVSIALGLVLSYVLEEFHVDHNMAWGVNLMATGIVSYVMVNRAMGVENQRKLA
eukprot:CFRG3363T1